VRGDGACSFIYRYIPRKSCSQFDSLPPQILATDRVASSSGERRASGCSGERLLSSGASALEGQQKQQVASVCNCGGCSASHRTNHIGAVVGPLLAEWLRSTKTFAAATDVAPSLLGLVPHILQWLSVAKTKGEKKGGGELELAVRNHALDGLRTIITLAQNAPKGATLDAGYAAACAQCADAVAALLQNSIALETSHVRALLELLLVASHAALLGASLSVLLPCIPPPLFQ